MDCVSQKASKTKAGILILPAWKGIDTHAKQSAEKLSKWDIMLCS
jgi:hypothetical protein